MDVNYDESDCPISPPLSDIIKSYSEARRLQQENEPKMAIEGDPIEDIDFPRANPTKNPVIMSPVDKLNPVNDNIFPPLQISILQTHLTFQRESMTLNRFQRESMTSNLLQFQREKKLPRMVKPQLLRGKM